MVRVTPFIYALYYLGAPAGSGGAGLGGFLEGVVVGSDDFEQPKANMLAIGNAKRRYLSERE